METSISVYTRFQPITETGLLLSIMSRQKDPDVLISPVSTHQLSVSLFHLLYFSFGTLSVTRKYTLEVDNKAKYLRQRMFDTW